MTNFVEGLWEANENDEIRYYLFHEPYQFLSNYWHGKEIIYLRKLSHEKLEAYLELFQPGTLNGIWGDGQGGWSKEYMELFE